MKVWQSIKRWLCGGCVYYTLIAILMLLVSLAMGSKGSVNIGSFLWMFPFGLSMSAAGMLLGNGLVARWVRFLLHHVITLLAIFLFLWLPSNASPTGAAVLVFFALLCVLYWILFGLIAFLRSRIRKLMEED